jgi:hypothetical protein
MRRWRPDRRRAAAQSASDPRCRGGGRGDRAHGAVRTSAWSGRAVYWRIYGAARGNGALIGGSLVSVIFRIKNYSRMKIAQNKYLGIEKNSRKIRGGSKSNLEHSS